MKFLRIPTAQPYTALAASILLLAFLTHDHQACEATSSLHEYSSSPYPPSRSRSYTSQQSLERASRHAQPRTDPIYHGYTSQSYSLSTQNLWALKKRSPSVTAARGRKRQNLTIKSPSSLSMPPPTPSVLSPSSLAPLQSSVSPSPSPPAPSSFVSVSQSQQPIALLLPQNEPNVSTRYFPYTPETGASNSLELTPNVTSREGLVEIRVGLLLPYSLPNNLTQQLAYSGTSAIRLAVSEINANHLIPGAYITLVLKDSFNGLDPENSGAAQAIFSTVSLLQTNGGVAGVIGDVSSALSMQSALLTSRLSIPQCSYSAGSTQLSSKDDYGYFFRTIPTELMFGSVMMDFVASRGWKTIAVIYTGDSLGLQMMDNIAVQAARKNITIGYQRAFWENGASSDVGPALDALADSGQRIVLVAAVSVPQVRLMIEAVNKGLISKNYVWLAINQITEPLLKASSTLKPTDLNGLFMFDNLLKLNGYPPYERFLDKWEALDPNQYPYAGQRDISSNEPQAYSCMMVMANAFANAIKGNWTALHLLAAGKMGPELRPVDMNTNYTGPGGPMVISESGDVVYGNFILYNFQDGEVVSIGTSYSGVFSLLSAPIYFDGTYDTPADSVPFQVLNPKYGSPIGLVVLSIAGLSTLFSLLTMLIVIVYRDAEVIKASSPLFCCLELCGFILLYIATIMGLDIPTSFLCIARPLALNVGFVLVVSNIVAKNFRVYRIFHNIYVTKRVIKDSHLLKIVGSIMFGNLIIVVVWFLKAPPTLEQIAMPDFTLYWTCNNAGGDSMPFFVIIFVCNAALMLVATYLAYMNRNVAANYNECRQIAFVVYNILLSACLAMPTVLLPREQFLTKFFLSTVVILFGTTFSLMFMFLPKLWELFTQIERSQQRNSNGGFGGGGSDESSMDGFIHSGATRWMNSAGNLVVLGDQSISGVGVGTGGPANDSDQHLTNGRKASVATLDEINEETLKETHMGYMGVKFQSRYLPFLSSWCMRRVVLFPTGRYFTCFEVGKPETGRTYTYISVSIHSREPGAYILHVVSCRRYDFLLQVHDEERLLYWYSLFDNSKQSASNGYSSSTGVGANMPLENLSMANLSVVGAAAPLSANSTNTILAEEVRDTGPGHQQRHENNRTLSYRMDQLRVRGHASVPGPGENYSGSANRGRVTQSLIVMFGDDDGYGGDGTSNAATLALGASPVSASSMLGGSERTRTLVGCKPCQHGDNADECRMCQLLSQDLSTRSNVVELSASTRVEDGRGDGTISQEGTGGKQYLRSLQERFEGVDPNCDDPLFFE